MLTEELCLSDNLAKLALNLQVYHVLSGGESIQLQRYGANADGGYALAEESLKSADVVMSYGVAGDTSFEEDVTAKHNKAVYAFDCSISKIAKDVPLINFIPECIASDKTIYDGKKSSGLVTSFTNQLDNLGLNNKKIFIKMDIEGAEYDAWNDIMEYSHQITGIVMEIHMFSSELQALKLTSELNKEFYLLNVHGNNCMNHSLFKENKCFEGRLPRLLELTYINKNLVSEAKLSLDQSHPSAIDKPNCPAKKELIFNLKLQ